MVVKLTSFLNRLIDAITEARVCEDEKWYNEEHFQALDSCLEEALELLHFESTRQEENKLQVSPVVSQRGVTRQSERKQKTISLPDEVLSVVFSYFEDSFHNPTNLSSNAHNFSLVCKSWHRAANRRLWQNVHLSDRNSTILFARSLYERHQSDPTRAKGSPLPIGDSVRGLHLHSKANICFPASVAYILDGVNQFTRNIVSLNLNGVSTDMRPLKVTELYEIVKLHPHLKHVWLHLSPVVLDSTEPLDRLPRLETCACSVWFGPDDVESLELISAKTISIGNMNVFKKDEVKSVFSTNSHRFGRLAHEFKQLTHLYLRHFPFREQGNDLNESISHIAKLPNLSFLVLDIKSHDLTDIYFDLIADHCSLTTFVITWQPSEDSVDSWISCIQKMGPKLLSVGIGLEGDEHVDHPCIFETIYENCPNLMTLELYGDNFPSDVWSFQLYASELENLCRLPLKWIYAPWFLEWPQKWKDSCPKFTRLCRLGLNIGLEDLPFGHRKLLDYNQPMRPAIVGDDLW